MKFPRLITLQQDGTHRLIPYRYSVRGRPILNLLAQNDEQLLSDLTALEGGNKRPIARREWTVTRIGAIELVSGFRLAHIVNATFTHSPSGRKIS